MLLLRLLLLAVMKLDVILIYVMNCRLIKILESVANTLIQSTVSVTTTVRVLFPVKSFFFSDSFSTAYWNNCSFKVAEHSFAGGQR